LARGKTSANQLAPPMRQAPVITGSPRRTVCGHVSPARHRSPMRQVSLPELLLARRDVLKAEVVKSFKDVAGSLTTIDVGGLRNFRAGLSKAIGVSEEVLGNLQAEFVRFDFDGDGRIHFNEAYKLVKHHLWAHLKRLGCISQVDVPRRSLDEAGYRVVRTLGRGSQAVVYLAADSLSRERCVKCYAKDKVTPEALSELKDEFESLQWISCSLIAHAFEIFQDAECYYMVGEAYHGGDLTTLKERATQQAVAMTENWWRIIFSQCFQALAFLHEQALMHCDIKEPNIMLRTSDLNSPRIVLIDFGVSRAMATADTGIAGGTPGYIPPETWDAKAWFPSGDVFSLGVCMVQLLLDKVPRNNEHWNTRGLFLEGCSTFADVMEATKCRVVPFQQLPQDMPDLSAVIQRVLRKQMMMRPRAPQVLEEAWFQAGRRESEENQHGLTARPTHVLGTMGISDALFHAVGPKRTGDQSHTRWTIM